MPPQKLRIMLTDDDGKVIREAPKTNDRWYSIELRNRGRTQYGTATALRMAQLVQAIKNRYPKAWKPKMQYKEGKVNPVVIRRRIAGEIVAIIKAIMPTKH